MNDSKNVELNQEQNFELGPLTVSLSVDTSLIIKRQLELQCNLFAIAHDRCSGKAGCTIGIDELTDEMDCGKDRASLFHYLSTLSDRYSIPKYDLIFHEPTFDLVVLNRLHSDSQQYLTKFLIRNGCLNVNRKEQGESYEKVHLI